MSLLFTPLLLGAVADPIPDFIRPKLTLKRSELVRYVEHGGMRREPLEMVLILNARKGILQTNKGVVEIGLTANQRATLRRALVATKTSTLNGEKRGQEYWPSAADGIDLFLKFRRPGQELLWTNYAHQEKVPTPALLQLVREVLASGRKKLKIDG